MDYDLLKSYAKEERMRQRTSASQFGQYTDDLLSIMLTADSWVKYYKSIELDYVFNSV